MLIADVLARMARGERFERELERRVMRAAAARVAAGGGSGAPQMPVAVRALWVVGLLTLGALIGQAVRIALGALTAGLV